MIEPAGAKHLNYLHEGYLDGVGIFEQRQVESALDRMIGEDSGALAADPVMKKAQPSAAERRRTALRAVDFDVLTSGNIFEAHIFVYHPLDFDAVGFWAGTPLPPSNLWNQRVSRKFPVKSVI